MFKLRELNYSTDAFSGFLSKEIFDFHYGKHHQTYVNNLNNLIKDTDYENKDLLDIITSSNGGVFNNAAQVYNHDFYFDCIGPKESKVSDALKEAIEKTFQTCSNFKDEFIKGATALFGSGWFWLVLNGDKLELVATSNANTPLTEGKIPLLVVDVWEHAYYLGYQNLRAKYLEDFYNHIDWDFVSKNYENAKKDGINSVRAYINNLHK